MSRTQKEKDYRNKSLMYYNFEDAGATEWKNVSLLRSDGSPRYITAELKKCRDGDKYFTIALIFRQRSPERFFYSSIVHKKEDLFDAFCGAVEQLADHACLTRLQERKLKSGYSAFLRRNRAKYDYAFKRS